MYRVLREPTGDTFNSGEKKDKEGLSQKVKLNLHLEG